MLRRRGIARVTGERGSVVMAMLVLMILAMLTGIAVDRVIAISHRTTHQRDRAAALESAEGALAVGFARVDRGEVASFSQSGTLGAGSYRIDAAPSDPDNWVLQGTGTSPGADASFTATMTRDRLYPFVLFTSTLLQISGPASGVEAPVGSSGAMQWNGLAGTFEQHLVGAAATCTGCTMPVVDVAERTYPAAPRPEDAESQPCPAGGLFTGDVDAGAGVPFRCEAEDVLFVDTVTVANGPMIVWVGPGRSVVMSAAIVNPGGLAGDFVLHKVDAGIETFDLEGATIVGVIDAPGTTIHVTSLDLTGAIVAAAFEDGDVGTDLIRLRADPSIVNVPGFAWWRIVDRRQVP